ncbi:MCE family protein [Mycolicibacterium elephantis]|uniref:MCE family protein n=1 Tax=Mycolicibacterium elephantis TaxID=81858 RepID=UPI0007EBFD31|nr:MCE family protein [Mycolicibacterium elephantis]OBB16364.1 MCE-family protein MCE3A [Mycolicibacterium elephantis]
MNGERYLRIRPAWWTVILIVLIAAVLAMTVVLFTGALRSYVKVTLAADRSGLVMESGAKVKLRGLQVGQVRGVTGGHGPVALTLELDPDKVRYIPANVEAQIRSTTAFGAKYVELIAPEHPAQERISSGAVLWSRNVTTEVNTVFQNLVDVMNQIQPDKLNGTLTALAQGFGGQGERMGQAITDTNIVLGELNSRADNIAADWRSFRKAGDAYASAARDIVEVFDNWTPTAESITTSARELDALLVSMIGMANSGIQLVTPNRDNLINAINVLAPTTDLVHKYNPTYTCLLLGSKWLIDNGLKYSLGGNGRSAILDASLVFGDDPYQYPKHLPIVGAKGGPGGKPGCASLPDPTKAYPMRQVVKNIGWGGDGEIRVNPGIGFPGWANYFPVTRAVPEPPSVRYQGPVAPGPEGQPPVGAQLYAPDGTPLYPGLPPAPPPGAPREPGPTPGAEPFTPFAPAQVKPTPLPVPPPA